MYAIEMWEGCHINVVGDRGNLRILPVGSLVLREKENTVVEDNQVACLLAL